jgi:hypothetical protein
MEAFMQKLSVHSLLVCCTLCGGCSQVPSLEAASGTDQPKILVSDIVKRIKCEIADSFDDRITNKDFLWLQNWTAKVDLTLQVNDTAGVSPSGSYTKFYRNAFNYAAGSTSLTSTVIAAVPQSLTLTAGANYSEQAQRSETVTFTLSLQEVKTWRQKKDRYQRLHYGADVADHFCDASQRELRGYLGLKEWIDSALYPVSLSDLQAGIHPSPASSTKPPSPSPPKAIEKGLVPPPPVSINEAKPEIDKAAIATAMSTKNANSSQASVGASAAMVQTAMTNSIGPYYAVLTDELKRIIANNLSTLTTIQQNVKEDADGAAAANEVVQRAAKIVDAQPPPSSVPQQLVDDTRKAVLDASNFEKDAEKQQENATAIQSKLTGFQPNPPIDALGHSIQFIVTYGGSITPNWSLLMWKGPGLTIPGAALSGVRTNILNIALGPTSEQNRLLLNQTLTNTLTTHP